MANSLVWKHINDEWPTFATNGHSIRLGLALDGLNPFGDLSSCHSTWPMIFFNYNLPPWLIIKQYFLILVLIIPRKEFVTFGSLDVYLQPLIEELQLLWSGVQTFDVCSKESFNLQAMCIWSVHYFPTYGLFVSGVTKGHVKCPLCGPAIDFHSFKKLKKMIFCGNSHYSSRSHPY